MPQDSISGAEANRRGHLVGQKVAELLGIVLNKRGSNEGYYKGLNCIIKYAAYSTTRFGINNDMLPRLAQVILAKETQESGKFELHLVAIGDIGTGTPSRSKGSEGRTTMFQVSAAIKNGHKIGEAQIG